MADKIFNVLFVCTGNSARSILAEGILNHVGAGRFRAFSAGSRPKGEVHPMALEVLTHLNMPHAGARSKSWYEFAQPGAPELDFVLTVCDNAAGEVCPVWPGQPVSAHWGVYDPAAVQGSEEARMHAFNDVAQILKRRIDLMLSLPPDKLERLSVHPHLAAIGQR